MQILKKESRIERETCRLALLHYGVHNVKFTTPGATGYPDRIFFIPGGCPLFIEFKAQGGKLSPKQKYTYDLLQKLNYNVEVHYATDTALKSIAAAVATAQLSKESG